MVSPESASLITVPTGIRSTMSSAPRPNWSAPRPFSPRSESIGIALAAADGFAVLDVIDHGPGIDPDERLRIFDSFYQGRPPIGGRVKGSGLGLAIARDYTAAHGGRLEVMDLADRRHGAHFRLLLPLEGQGAAGARRSETGSAPVTVAGRQSAARGEPSAAGPPQGAAPPGGAARSAARGEPPSPAGGSA